MYKIFHSCKFKLYLFSRCYGNQNKLRTHYDTLRIPQTSSQKEIREAFIKLSKEMHPDIKGKESHSEFVKVNEAYNILSKEHLRGQYDMNIKQGYSPDNSSYSYPSDSYSYKTRRSSSGNEYYRQSPHFTSRDEWDEYINSQANDNYYGVKGIKRMKTIWIVFVCISITSVTLVVQIVTMNKALQENRELLISRTTKYQRDYKKLQDEARSKSKKDQLQDFESKILTKHTKNTKTSPLGEIN